MNIDSKHFELITSVNIATRLGKLIVHCLRKLPECVLASGVTCKRVTLGFLNWMHTWMHAYTEACIIMRVREFRHAWMSVCGCRASLLAFATSHVPRGTASALLRAGARPDAADTRGRRGAA